MICAILDDLRPGARPYADLITFVADRPGHDARYAIDPTRIRTELGWRPSVTVEEGLERTVRMVSGERGLVARAAEPRRASAAAGHGHEGSSSLARPARLPGTARAGMPSSPRWAARRRI